MKTPKVEQVITNITFFVLLVLRFPIGDLLSNLARLITLATIPSWTEKLSSIQNWNHNIYNTWSFILVGFAILVNKSNLKCLNIDQDFIFIFISGGLAFSMYFFWPTGWAAFLLVILISYLLLRNQYKFEKTNLVVWRIVLIIGIVFFLSLIFIRSSINSTKIRLALHLFLTEFPFVIIEEITFRGLLWMFLKSLNCSGPIIILVQGVLFWLAHAFYIFSEPILFWIIIPISSILFGIIVWRSRSITTSTVAHSLLNVFLSLIY